MENTQYSILVVDDDTRIRQLLSKYLRKYDFTIFEAIDSETALEQIKNNKFDLLILDVMMPGLNGIELTKKIRNQYNIPILMLTALSETIDRIKGLQAGVDDYLPKPFDPQELLLRVNAILRRQSNNETEKFKVLHFGPFTMHPTKRFLSKNGKVIALTRKEVALIQLFYAKKNKIVTRDELSEIDGMVNARTIDVQITRLRKKLEDDASNPIWLKTIRGNGYCLTAN